MVIRVLDHVARCYTATDGLLIAAVIRPQLASGRSVTLSFDGVTDVPSSFVNGAFVSLLDCIPAIAIRRHLKITDSTRQINDLIRSRLLAEESRASRIYA